MSNYDMIGTVPFFGGGINSSKDSRKVRERWLSKTIKGMEQYCSTIVIGVCTDEDFESVKKILSDFKEKDLYKIVKVGDLKQTSYLPVSLLSFIQKNIPSNRYIFFTESDQIFHIKNIDQILNKIEGQKNLCVAPHRCIKLCGNEKWGEWPHFGHELDVPKADLATIPPSKRYQWVYDRFWQGDHEYVVCNKPHAMNHHSGVIALGCCPRGVNKQNIYKYFGFMETDIDPTGKFYVNTDNGFAYGAAFICHVDTFNRVNFNLQGIFPLENASFNVFDCPEIIMVKTVNTQDFWVDHLSHRFNMNVHHRNHIK